VPRGRIGKDSSVSGDSRFAGEKANAGGRNPKTGQEVPIPGRPPFVYSLRASNVLKSRINGSPARGNKGVVGKVGSSLAYRLRPEERAD